MKTRTNYAITRAISALILVIILAAAIVGVYAVTRSTNSTSSSTSSSSSSSSTSPSSNTLVMDDSWWPDYNMNPAYTEISDWPNWAAWSVYQPLVNVNLTKFSQTGQIQYLPGLAMNWSVSSNNMTYTFNLRQGVKFSNGDPFNSYQVWAEMYGWYYISANDSAWVKPGYAIFNMSNVSFGPSTISLLNQSGLISPSLQVLSMMENNAWPIYVTGPYQIVFNLKAPFPWFLGSMIAYQGLIYDIQWMLQNGGWGTPASINTIPNTVPVPGTGPYMITQVSTNAFVKFAQNPYYWDENSSSSQTAANPMLDPGHFKNVIIYYKTDDIARYTDLTSGAAQIVVIEQDWSLITENPSKFSFYTLPAASSALINAVSLNTQLYPTNITAVRQAIVHAINYSAIDQEAFHGEVAPMVGPEYPAQSQFYDLGGASPYQYNLTLASKILSDAGINPANLPTLNFPILSSCPYCITVASIVQSDLGALGITVNIEVQSGSVYWTPYQSYSASLQYSSQIGNLGILEGSPTAPDTLTPADFWASFVSNESIFGDWALYSNPTVQKCVDSFFSGTPVANIVGLCTSAQSQINNDAPYAWLGAMKLLPDTDGSLVWENGVVSSFYVDPLSSGQDTMPLMNTVVLG